MGVLRVIITLWLLASLVTTGSAQQAGSAGNVKVVAQIIKQENIRGPYDPSYSMYKAPGYLVKVVSSNVDEIKTGQEYYVQILVPDRSDPVNPAMDIVTFPELTPGTTIGIKDYWSLEKDHIMVYLDGTGEDALHEKVTIMSPGSAKPATSPGSVFPGTLTSFPSIDRMTGSPLALSASLFSAGQGFRKPSIISASSEISKAETVLPAFPKINAFPAFGSGISLFKKGSG